jgi:predicted GNAT superfamily acetyltransferase
MVETVIRAVHESDYAKVVELNAGEVQHTSAMDLDRVLYLDSLSAYHRLAELDGTVAAFLLAMKDHTPYRNDNFDWFSARYEQFLYIDRIVVGSHFQGKGIGSLLYRDLFAYARSQKISLITCEINIIPPNRRSFDFHAAHGFKEVGSQWLGDGQKKVSMQAADAM